MSSANSSRARRWWAFVALIGVLVTSSGLALTASAGSANAVGGPDICHPVNGKGGLGNGWSLIGPAQASAHLDEVDGNAPQHTSKDGSEGPCTEVVPTPTVCPYDTDRAGEPQAAAVSAPAMISTVVQAGLVGPATDRAAPSLWSQGLFLALAGALALLIGGLGAMRRRGVGTDI